MFKIFIDGVLVDNVTLTDRNQVYRPITPSSPDVTYSDIVNNLIIMRGTAEGKSQLVITNSEGNTYTLTVLDNSNWSMAITYQLEGKFTIASVDAIGNKSDVVPIDNSCYFIICRLRQWYGKR